MNSLRRILCAVVLVAGVTCFEIHEATGEIFAPGKYLSADACLLCHAMSTQDLERSPAKENRVLQSARDFVHLDEGLLWHRFDIHREAEKVLCSPRSKQIIDSLVERGSSHGKPERTTIEQQCSNCHFSKQNPNHFEPLAGLDPAKRQKEGVGCEACHGPGSSYLGPHLSTSWRTLSGDTKQRDFGMIDVRNPVERARLCLSCHLGDPSSGKLITHEMYAAGHPPLPSFEIEAFAENMPRHWRFPHQKTGVPAEQRGTSGVAQDEFPRTRRVVIGGLTALESSLKLLANWSTIKAEQNAWPEFSEFDCAACHHDLRTPSWRQERGYGRLMPGRPRLRMWTDALFDVLCEDDEELVSSLTDLQSATNQQTFGDSKRIHDLATQSLQVTTRQLAVLQTRPWSQSDVHKTMLRLAQRGQEPWVNFDAGRQIAWALSMMQRDLANIEDHTEFTEAFATLNCLFDLVTPLQDWDADRNDTLLKLQPELLELRAEYRPQNGAVVFAKLEQLIQARLRAGSQKTTVGAR